MSEEKVQDVQPQDSVTPVTDAFRALVDDTVKLADSLGRAVVAAVNDLPNYMVIKVDRDTREHLDLLVDAGVEPSRSAAASSLLRDGIRAQQATFDRIARTHAQIKELRQQLRTLVPGV